MNATNGPVRVLVADDHVPTRRGVRLALDGHGFVVCAEALDGEAALPRALTARVIDEFRARERSRRLKILLRSREITLTAREWEVLELLGQGLVTSEIAERISTSDATVRSHVRGILKKLHVPDRKGAIRLLEGRVDG